jgi:hypothetical protein
MESLFAACLNGLLQQNLPGPAFKPLWREPMPDAFSGQ